MANVRCAYSQDAEWRNVLGNTEPLYCFALHGYSLDAPENIPAGATKQSSVGRQIHAQGLIVYRWSL